MGKTYNKLRSQNYRFASDQKANEALKSATSFNEPIKKIFDRFIKTRSRFQRFICFLIAGETIILTSELIVGFAHFLLFCFGLLYIFFFWLGLFSATGNSINSEKIFCFLLISIHASSADEVWY